MIDATHTYPLQWPTGWPRTVPGFRKSGRFSTQRESPLGGINKAITVVVACDRLYRELEKIGARSVILNSNLELGSRGKPLGGRGEPADAGVVLYFQMKNRPTTLPCDRYKRVAENIAAIAAHIEATRAIERHGVGTLDQMFTGFQAVRGPGPKPWREVLGFPVDAFVTSREVRVKYHAMAGVHHPDRGGEESRMAEINAAHDAALEEIGRVRTPG